MISGVFPLALVNFITLAGGGFDHEPGAGVQLKTMGELAHEVNTAPLCRSFDNLNETVKSPVKSNFF